METREILMHFSTQQNMAVDVCVSFCCALEKKNWINLITSNCNIPFVCVQLQSTTDDVPRQIKSLYVFMVHPRNYVHV